VGRDRRSGKKRDVRATTLEPPLGNGAYRIKEFVAGRTIVLERVKDYWGKDLNVNIGAITSTSCATSISATPRGARGLQGRRARLAHREQREELGDRLRFPAVKDKRVMLEEFPIARPGGCRLRAQHRRDKFKDPRVRLRSTTPSISRR
jgi:microcin C transport system substrate-binding protein